MLIEACAGLFANGGATGGVFHPQREDLGEDSARAEEERERGHQGVPEEPVFLDAQFLGDPHELHSGVGILFAHPPLP